MIVPRLRSEARGGSSSGSSNRYSNSGVYGGKVHHGHHNNDPDLKRALQYSYTSQTVRKWEKRWVVIHETSMKVHKWMPAPVTVASLASQIVAEKTAAAAAAATTVNDSTILPSTNENENENEITNKMEINQTETIQQTQELNKDQPEEDKQDSQEEIPQQTELCQDQEKQIEVQSENPIEQSSVVSTQDTQMLVDEESVSQSSQP